MAPVHALARLPGLANHQHQVCYSQRRLLLLPLLLHLTWGAQMTPCRPAAGAQHPTAPAALQDSSTWPACLLHLHAGQTAPTAVPAQHDGRVCVCVCVCVVPKGCMCMPVCDVRGASSAQAGTLVIQGGCPFPCPSLSLLASPSHKQKARAVYMYACNMQRLQATAALHC